MLSMVLGNKGCQPWLDVLPFVMPFFRILLLLMRLGVAVRLPLPWVELVLR